MSPNERASRRRINRARWFAYGALSFVFLLVVLLFLAAAAYLVPYRAMTIEKYEAATDEVCPNQVVMVYVDYDVEEGVDITSMDVRAGWEAVAVDDYPVGTQLFLTHGRIPAPDDYFAPGYHQDQETRAPRVSPSKEGVWTPTSEVTVYGKRWGFVPAVEKIDGTDQPSEPIRVVDGEEC